MATEKTDRSVQFIAKLVQLTQDREIRWEATPFAVDQVNSAGGAAYITIINQQRLRIRNTKREVKVNDPFGVVLGSKGAIRTVTEAVLEVMDDFDQVSYTFDRIAGLNDLYESAAFSASKIGDLMDSVLRMESVVRRK